MNSLRSSSYFFGLPILFSPFATIEERVRRRAPKTVEEDNQQGKGKGGREGTDKDCRLDESLLSTLPMRNGETSSCLVQPHRVDYYY